MLILMNVFLQMLMTSFYSYLHDFIKTTPVKVKIIITPRRIEIFIRVSTTLDNFPGGSRGFSSVATAMHGVKCQEIVKQRQKIFTNHLAPKIHGYQTQQTYYIEILCQGN